VAASDARATFEELVFRGYLIARLERLLQSTRLAVVVSTGLFAGLHTYQGTIGVLNATVIGLACAIWFCMFRRLWPLCLVHAANNFVAVSAYGWN
jgi:membrane protease YdiL (CAAX protease family)